MIPEVGITGLIVILIVALLVFGPKRLPEIGRSLGKGMREFKDSITGKDKDGDEERDAFGEPAKRPRQAELHPTAAEPEVVTGEARREDQPASRADS